MSLLDKLPSWVAFLGLILVGAAMVIIGIFLSKTAQLGFIDFGECCHHYWHRILDWRRHR